MWVVCQATMAACQNLAVLAILTFIFYCAAATELNELNHASVMGSVKEGFSQEWMFQKHSGDQQTYQQRGQADYQANQDNLEDQGDNEDQGDTEDQGDHEHRDNEDDGNGDHGDQEDSKNQEDNNHEDQKHHEENENHKKEEKVDEQKEEHSAASTPPESTIDIIKTVFNDAVEMLTKKTEKEPMCSYMTTRIKKLRDKGEISEDPEKYIELTVHKGKFVPLMSFLPMKLTSPQLAFISFDCETNEIKIETQPGLNLRVIPTIMELKNVQFSLSAVLTRITKTLEIDMKGSWFMGPLSFQANVSHSRSSGSTEISILSKSVSIDKIVKQLTGLTLPGAPQKLPSFKFSGYIESGGSATLILSSDQSKKNKFYAFYHQDKGQGAPVKAIAADITNLKLSSLLKNTMRVDISRVPVLGNITVKNIALSVSSGEITNLPKNIFSKTKLLNRNGVTIASGLKAYIMLPYLPNPMTATYSHEVLTLRTTSNELRLESLLSFLGSKFNLGKMSLPKQLHAIFSISVKKIEISKDQLSIIIAVPKPVSFFNKLLSFSKIIVTLYISNETPKLSVKATGNVQLAGANFQTVIFQDKYRRYTLMAKGKYLDINKVLIKLSAEVLPPTISSFLKNTRFLHFLHFEIQKPFLLYKFQSKPMYLELGGTPVIHGFKSIHFSAIITKIKNKNAVILGFGLYKINLAHILKTVTGFNFHHIAILDQELTFTLTVSPSDSPHLHFSRDELRSVPITKGVSIGATITLPSKCDKNKICKLTRKIVKVSSLSFKVEIKSKTYISITASIRNIQLGKNFVLSKASLTIVAAKLPSIGITGSIILKKYGGIELSGTISVNKKGFSVGMSLGNCWKNVFKQRWLTICNLLGSANLKIETGYLTVSSFQLGGEIRLGYNTSSQITAQGYIGINNQKPNENYYYASFSNVTVGSILKAFNINVRIPKPLAISGFPTGVLLSYSKLGQELPQIRKSIPPGIRLKGHINILGFMSNVDVDINLPNYIKIFAELPPIKIGGGLLKMYASLQDKNKGPYLNADIQILPTPHVNIEAKGFVKLLGITSKASLKISNRMYNLFVSGKLWGLFRASLLVHARYGSIERAGFRIQGDFKDDLFEKIEQTIVKRLSDSARKATAAIKKAQATLDHKQQRLDRAYKKVSDARQEIARNKMKFENAGNKVKRTKERLKLKCQRHKCKKILRIPDIKCLIRNAACWVFRKAIHVILTVAEKVARGAAIFLNVAKAGLSQAQRTVRTAKSVVNGAKQFLRSVNKINKFGIKAAKWITKFSLAGLINIRRIYFDLSLRLVKGGHFAAKIDVTFFKSKTVNAKINLNIKCVWCMAKEIAKRMGKGIVKLLG